MYHLAELLGIPLPYAVGIMEMLWHYAGVNTPRGDIGCQPNEAIREACGFTRKAAVLSDALVTARWLDRDDEHRLILHDWPDHCEQAVVKLLEDRKHDFLPVYGKSIHDRMKKKSRGSLSEGYEISRDSLATREAKALVEVDFELQKNPEIPFSPVLEIGLVLEECEDLYAKAGRPFPTKHRQLAAQYLVGIEPGKWPRIPAYVRWALGAIWSDASKTKSFLNLLRDGDWDVDITPRTIPAPSAGGKQSGLSVDELAAL